MAYTVDTDIVESLRYVAKSAKPVDAGQMREAANEIERLRAERRWISVEERLPEPDYMGNPVGVLTCLPDGERCIGFCDNDEYGVRWHCQSTQKPTHWMPLPEPPEVK